MKSVYINISDVSSYIGLNKWDYVTPFERLWKKCDVNYDECLNELQHIITVKKNNLIVIENEKSVLESKVKAKEITKRQYTKAIKEVEKKVEESKVEIEKEVLKVENVTLTQSEKIEKTFNKVEPNLSINIIETIKKGETSRKAVKETIEKLHNEGKIKEETKIELLNQTESLINKTHGTLKEQSAIDIFENKYNVKLDISQKYYCLSINKSINFNWFVGGKLDGIYINENPEKSFIVEVKNRIKGFFSSVRDYELTQIQLYLHLLHINNGKLVEKYGKNIRVTEIEYDNEFINETLEYIRIFTKNMEKFVNDKELKMKYLNSSESNKQKILSNLYINEICKKRLENEERKIAKNSNQELMSDLDSD